MKQMMQLADCMENAPGPMSSTQALPKQVKVSSAKWIFIFVLSLGVVAAAWPALAYTFGRFSPTKEDEKPKPLWASGAIAALLLGMLTFVLVRLLL